jgi:hypothetical protein
MRIVDESREQELVLVLVLVLVRGLEKKENEKVVESDGEYHGLECE